MDRSLSLARRASAEAIAAFTLVFAGCGAIIADYRYDGALGAVGVSLVFGLVIMVMVYATGHLSGAHINPAVTVAFTLTRHFGARDAVVYIAAQLAGATAAALVLLGVWTDKPANLGATVPTIAAGSAVLYEAVLTAFLMFVIMAVATDTRAVGAGAAIAIGGVIGLDALFGGPVTGASMNPARRSDPRSCRASGATSGSTSSGRWWAPAWGHSPTRSCAASMHRYVSLERKSAAQLLARGRASDRASADGVELGRPECVLSLRRASTEAVTRNA